MTLVLHVLLLLLLAALSRPLVRLLPVPLPLVQIAMGVLANVAGLRVEFDPDTFLLLFIPPLLFSDAFTVSKRAFFELRRIIAAMAIGLVVFSTLAGGLLVHALLPTLTIPAGIALAAILSPTDSVAIGAILRPGSASKRFLHILEGEALLNDATGLVCFRFAVAATMTGAFSLADASISFAAVAIGGLAIGAAFGWAFDRFDRAVVLPVAGDAPTQILLLLLLPFAAYLAADALGTSGILASVAAGFTVSQLRLFGATDTQTRLSSGVILVMVGFVFNGLIFLLLGLQLPALLRDAGTLVDTGRYSAADLGRAVVLLSVGLVLLRFVWIWLAIGIRAGLAAAVGRRYAVKTNPVRAAAMAVAGVRGAVTLAGILTLPAATATGGGFPDREALVVVAAGVIACSIVLASVFLPILLRMDGGPAWEAQDESGRSARQAMAHAALDEIEAARKDAFAAAPPDGALVGAATALFEEWSRRAAQLGDAHDDDHRAARLRWMEGGIRLRALRAQRAALLRLARHGQVGTEIERQIVRELDFEEELVQASQRRLSILQHPALAPAGPAPDRRPWPHRLSGWLGRWLGRP